ncbi:MAG: SLC13 family permease [Candidatus Omnitrophica bacterium]|nr:SLC13 family permease [Candidatus Omnitrophota bacterium]
MSNKIFLKFLILFITAIACGFLSISIGMNTHQALSVSIFSASVMGTLLFWDFRLAIAFLGIAILLMTRTVDLENVIKFASLEVILFLVGMMVLIGLLKEVGFFAWLIGLIIRIKKLTAKKFVVVLCLMSAILACAVDEVTSIIFMSALVLEICDYFEVLATPYIIMCVLATNIGSSGTVLGNPIGILIAAKGGLTFEDFIFRAFPLMFFCLLLTISIFFVIFKKPIKELDKKIKEFGYNEILIKLISVPPEKQLRLGLGIFGVTLFFIGLHHRLELLWNLETNTILLVIPLISAGFVMVWKHRKAKEYIEKEVDWWTLLFFMLLFAKAGTLKYTGATDVLAKYLVQFAGKNPKVLVTNLLWTSCIGSSILDNVVLVAAFIPIVQSFHSFGFVTNSFWWALLFGGCFGGNITMIGSTANIVALGLLEKEKGIKIKFFRWLGIGLIIGVITTLFAWLYLIITS